ncbi:MAG: PKD domain-containing protein [Thermoplasmata archaeon]|nr:PKD domain-containing protein [Thermoplasmata archaeon]
MSFSLTYSEHNPPRSTRAVKLWTVMIYMDGDNNLEEFAIQDFNELETVGSTSEIDILVQIDRHPNDESYTGFTSSNGDWNETRRYVVKSDLTGDKVNFTEYTEDEDMWDLGELNMGIPGTLSDFLDWGLNNYPSEHYLLVMWDHGTGIFSSRGTRGDSNSGTRSFCQDQTSQCSMKLWELDEVLKAKKGLTTNNTFDIVGFDMCWLGHLETGYEIMDSVDFMVASSDEEPDVGWNYGPPIGALSANPEMTPQEFAIQITNDFIDEFKGISNTGYITQAAIDLKELNATFIPKLNEFANELKKYMVDYKGLITTARKRTDEPCSRSIYADIYHFAELIWNTTELPDSLRESAFEIMVDFDKVVIAEGHGASHPNGHGLTLYFPRTVNSYYSQYESVLDFAVEEWDEFILHYLHPMDITHKPLKDTEKVGPHEITATIRGDNVNEDKILVYYTKDDVNFSGLQMKPTGETDEYQATIQNQSMGTTLHYYIRVSDVYSYIITSPLDADTKNLDSLYSFYIGLDHIKPEIYHNTTNDFIINDIDQPYNVSAKIMDNTELDSNKLFIFYNIDNSSNYTKLNMLPSVNEDKYYVTLPPEPEDATLYYYFQATDKAFTPNTARSPTTGTYDIFVVTTRPVASFETNISNIDTLDSIEFTSTSEDDGVIVNWTWEFGDGGLAYGPQTSYSFKDDGIYPVVLTVIDDTGFQGNISIDITVNNRLPLAVVTADNTLKINNQLITIINGTISATIYEDDVIEFDSNSSYDLDGNIVAWTWEFGDGILHHERWYDKDSDGIINHGNEVFIETVFPKDVTIIIPNLDSTFDGVTSHQYFNNGKYLLKLTVEDDDGGQSESTLEITIVNKRPSATAGYTEIKGKRVSFSAYHWGSTRPDSASDIASLNYTWEFGDGSIGYGINQTHTYSKSDKYSVTLTVTDDDGDYDQDTIRVELEDDDNLDLVWAGILVIILVIIILIIVYIGRKPVKKEEPPKKTVKKPAPVRKTIKRKK